MGYCELFVQAGHKCPAVSTLISVLFFVVVVLQYLGLELRALHLNHSSSPLSLFSDVANTETNWQAFGAGSELRCRA
jgi:hypothetical protein